MSSLYIIDTISDPGKIGRANEDRAGYNNHAAFVLDGATGLGDQQFMDGYGSDAAWIAEFAMERLARDWQAGADIRDLVRQISTDAREVFFATAGEQPRYAWPLAAFAALHTTEQGVTFTGLGDSAVYLLHDDGRSEFLAARPDAFEREQAAARAHLERIGGMGGASSIVNDPETLVDLRKSRELQNTPGGRGWSFGMVPEVADHLTSHEIAISGGATAIICSDGLVDLVSLYQAYDAGSLIRRAATAGLRSLVAELRRFEREIDPNALQYPRFKQSDDTTALLLRVERG